MVTYELVARESDTLTYRYWPEDDRLARCGTFVVDLSTATARLVEPAEGDFKSHTTGRDMNAMRDEINRMRLESGEPALTEEELPTEPDDKVYEWWTYFDGALRNLSSRNDAGEIPERGMAAWY